MSIASRYTGLFRVLGETPNRAHDPDVHVWAGVPANRPWPAQDATGGAGWTAEDAERACMGEAIERWQTHALAADGLVRAAYSELDGAIDPRGFVRYHREQTIPFERLDETTVVDWVRCRTRDGAPIWAPADLVFLDLRPGHAPRFGPTISTGWSAHASAQAAFEAAVLELVERDAIVGAWWGSYPLVEVEHTVEPRLARANLRYRWYRVITPYAKHVAIVTVEGDDREGYVFSIGSACRLDAGAAFAKAALEAVQGRHYVRYLLPTTIGDVPTTFAEHAAYYSRHRARLVETCLANADRGRADAPAEPFAAFLARLPALAFRHATPPALVDLGYVVMRVIIPELQPLHGDHRLPFLGGPLWNRPLAAWVNIPPHPFA